MANYSDLIQTINDNIKSNGNQEITGPVLNAVLQAMVSALGEGYQFMGVATPDTNPGTPDGRVFYIATQAGTYMNFGGIILYSNLNILFFNNQIWSNAILDIGLDTLECQMFNLDTQNWVFSVKGNAVASNTPIVLSYLGKTHCTFNLTAEGLDNFKGQITAKNKETMNPISLYAPSEAVSFPIQFENPRPDLELVDIQVIFNSEQQGSGIFSLEITKDNPFNVIKDNVAQNTSDITSLDSRCDTLEGQMFNLDTQNWAFKTSLIQGGDKMTVVLPYLGRTTCSFNLSGDESNFIGRVYATNKYTGSTIVLLDAGSPGVSLPATFENPRPDLELVDITIQTGLSQPSGNLTLQITKDNPITNLTKDIDSEMFNLNTQDWIFKYSGKFTGVYSEDIVLDYLGKTECTFKFRTTSNQNPTFVGRIYAKNKATGNEIVLQDSPSTSPISLPVEFENPRPDLELIDVTVRVSASNETNIYDLTITKKSPLLQIKEEVDELQKQAEILEAVSDIPIEDYDSDFKFDSGTLKSGYLPSEIYDAYDSLMSDYPDYITKTLLGNDESGLYQMYEYDFIPKWQPDTTVVKLVRRRKIIILTGIHPEARSIQALINIMTSICSMWQTNRALEFLRWNVEFKIIPCASPWAVANASRVNSRGVDINRNFESHWVQGTYEEPPSSTSTYGGSAPLSEKESQYINGVIEANLDADMFIDFHNNYSETLFWIPLEFNDYNKIVRNVSCNLMKLADRRLKQKFTYIPSTYQIGLVDITSSGGSSKNQAQAKGIPSATFECANDNVEGFTNVMDILTITHDTFINYLLMLMRYL